MGSVKLSLTLTPELAGVLERLCKERGDERSRLVEMLLRESPLVAQRVGILRTGVPGQVNPGTKNGRDIEKLLALGDMARRSRERKIAEGRMRVS